MIRLITSQRLEEGLWSSADVCQRCCMSFATMLLVLVFFVLWGNETVHFAQVEELDHARSTVLELPCDGADSGGFAGSSAGTSIVHLTGCKVTGLANFTVHYPGLEFLRGFNEILPERGFRGVFFKAHLRQYQHEGKSSSWNDVDEIENLHETVVFSPSPRIGAYEGESHLFSHLPVSIVPLRRNSHFKQEVGYFSSVTPPYSLKNMVVNGNHLYTSTSCPGTPYDDDVDMWFTVADSTEVSVIARQLDRKLVPWTVRDFDSIDFTRAVTGAVAARPMIDTIQHEVVHEVWETRSLGILLSWLGTWLLIFPAYVIDLCDKKAPGDRLPEDCFSCCRALPISLLPTMAVIATSWGTQRNCLLTICTASILLYVGLLLGLGRNPCPASKEEWQQLVNAPGLLQRWPSAQWPNGVRPTTGSRVRVRIRAHYVEGSIIRDDHTDVPYKVLFDNDPPEAAQWYKEQDVLPVVDEPLLEAEEPLPQGLEEASSPPVPLSLLGSIASIPQLSHSLRVMAMAMALGLAVSIVGAIAQTFGMVPVILVAAPGTHV